MSLLGIVTSQPALGCDAVGVTSLGAFTSLAVEALEEIAEMAGSEFAVRAATTALEIERRALLEGAEPPSRSRLGFYSKC